MLYIPTTLYWNQLLSPPSSSPPVFPPLPILPLPASWTQRWDAMKTWKEAHDSGCRLWDLICACRQELSHISVEKAEIALKGLFIEVSLAATEFNDRYPRNGDPVRIEILAKQALCKVQQKIDQLYSFWHPIRDIYEWLISRMIGNPDKNLVYHPEQKLDNALNRISILSSRMGPATSHSKNFRHVLKTALSALRELRNHSEYHDCLQASMRKQGILILTLLRHEASIDIESEDSKLSGKLCFELQQIAHNLAGFAAQRADQYQKLYEYILINRKSISQCLDEASKGQGQSIANDLINDLKEASSSSRRETDFWKSQIRHLSPMPDLEMKYQSAINKMLNLESSERTTTNHDCNSASADVPNKNVSTPEAQNVAEAARKVSVSHSKVPMLQNGRIRTLLLKTQPDVNSSLDKTKAYFEYVANETKAQPSRSVTKSIAMKALSVAESWKRLYRKVNFAVLIFGGLFSCKIQVTASALVKELDLKVSTNDHNERTISTGIISKNLHPFLSDLEFCVLDIQEQYSSFANFLSNIPSTLPDFNNFV